MSKNSSSNDTSARAEAARQVLEADQRRRRRTVAIQVAVVVVVVAAVIVGTVIGLRGSDDNAAAGAAPAAVTDDGSYVVGNPDAAVTVQVIEDFQCPACQAFEAGFGDQLDAYAAGGDVNVAYRGIAFLDRASSTDYSSRALNASACVMDAGDTEVWKEFHRQMFLQQPAEGGAGLPDSELIRIAADAGADIESCVDDQTYADWVSSTTAVATGDDDFGGTPTVFVDGELVETSPAAIMAAVDEALAS